MTKASPKGYCEKFVTHMNYVSNRKLCGGSVNKNIGFYFKVTFTVFEDDEAYVWKIPTDFGHGGVSMIDGKVM
jgi:hypothetical protein